MLNPINMAMPPKEYEDQLDNDASRPHRCHGKPVILIASTSRVCLAVCLVVLVLFVGINNKKTQTPLLTMLKHEPSSTVTTASIDHTDNSDLWLEEHSSKLLRRDLGKKEKKKTKSKPSNSNTKTNSNTNTSTTLFSTEVYESESASQCIINDDGWIVSSFEEFPVYPEIGIINPSWWSDFTYNTGADTKDDAQEPLGLSVDASFMRSFDVVPNHTVLPNHRGVIFHVETTPDALPEHLSMGRLTPEQLLEAVQQEAGKFYQPPVYPIPPLPNVEVEVMSTTPNDQMVFAGGQGFVAACMMAFAYHLPLQVGPEMLWTIIASGFAHHIDQHAEELRHHFVSHSSDEKMVLEIQENSILQSQSTPEQWENLIFPKFSQEIGKHMNNSDVYELLVESNFTTSTPTSQAASEITLMAAMKSYFEYKLDTTCGIPRIQLDGTKEDWLALRQRAEQLAPWMMPNHAQGELWIKTVVLPILDQFVLAYEGQVNFCFWQSMVKFRNTNDRSGAYDFLSGWLPNLFPYLHLGNGMISPNRYLRHWTNSALGDQRGPDPSSIPIQLASAPVLWKYYGQEFPLHFHAGFRGVEQINNNDDDGKADSANKGMLRPVLGWYVTHDPDV